MSGRIYDHKRWEETDYGTSVSGCSCQSTQGWDHLLVRGQGRMPQHIVFSRKNGVSSSLSKFERGDRVFKGEHAATILGPEDSDKYNHNRPSLEWELIKYVSKHGGTVWAPNSSLRHAKIVPFYTYILKQRIRELFLNLNDDKKSKVVR